MGLNDAYLPQPHRERADRLRRLWLLFTGDHEQYYVTENCSKFHFRPLRRGGRPFYSPFDLLGLISRKTADMLFGEAPRIKSAKPAIKEKLEDLIERSVLPATLLSIAVDCSWAGEAFAEIVQQDGRSLITLAPVREMFPLGPVGADGQARRYVRYATQVIEVDGPQQTTSIGGAVQQKRRITLLLETNYEPGLIRNACYELSDSGAKVGPTDLSRWPVKTASGGDLPPEQRTGLKDVSIVRFRNDAVGESDYTKQLVTLQDALNAKQTQLARVIMKHADPKMYFATGQANGEGNVSADDDAIFGDTPEAMPKYITWEAQLAAAIEDRKFALLALATVAEMPLSVLGVKDDSTVESAAKMRLSAINAIAKAQRKSAYHVGAIRLLLVRALAAELVTAVTGDISIQTRDGIPDDETERANVIATLRAANAISLRRSLAMQQLDDTEIDAELVALSDETKQQTPSILFGEPGQGSETSIADAGIGATNTLNGAQISSVIDVIGQMQAGAIGDVTAVELLVSVGIAREKARAIVAESRTREGAGDVTRPPDAGAAGG